MPAIDAHKGKGRSTPRSQSGCSNCRRSKVKCDEKQPVCTRCLRKDLHCSRNPLTLKWEAEYHARGLAFGRTGVWRKHSSTKEARRCTAGQTSLATPSISQWSFLNTDSSTLQHLLDQGAAGSEVVLMPARNVKVFRSTPSIRPAPSVSPIVSNLEQGFFFDYYINQICPRTNPSQVSQSPFSSVILPYCISGPPAVIKALMALAACHWAQQDSRYAVHALRLKAQVVADFRRRIASDNQAFLLSPDPEVLVLIMLLCLYEIVDHCDRRWIVHLQGAKDIILLRRQQLPQTTDPNPVSEFVELFFAFQDVMGRTACAKADLFGSSYWPEDDSTINDWMGCSPSLVSILFATMDLSRNRRNVVSTSEELTFCARASNLQRRLDNLIQRPAVGREDEILCIVAECKKLSCQIYIQCALHGADPSTPSIKATVKKILKGLSSLVAKGGASHAMWPLFVAAVELDPLDDVILPDLYTGIDTHGRRVVLQLLTEMAKTSVSSISRTRAVIEGVWERRDFYLHGTNGGRKSGLNDWEQYVVPGSDALSLV
ncbi:hypothetical protein BO94DRAFT_567255 [Aspergillus sclerotioniger CBS 115572]|uniref:Zn(2)-C6 fungal-type domain-containing protein n=1 Tax=Aspergillus sclerotioniger CBS 115572 TaxID=1450535 RepID=A0A317W9A5_9EURO|nr:hypothetical protein BO94DRAFT_567255 [Aspergillus sclerotioniger CBS 115572]PWY81588.1 hypothetical protein BO94DRAFT_567255 [Aspergillus sclerotioniger CBS 115572]